jgi:hypothetical protein
VASISSCDAFLPALVRRRLFDQGTTDLLVSDARIKERLNTMDHLHLYAIMHYTAIDHLCLYIEFVIISSHALWAQ